MTEEKKEQTHAEKILGKLKGNREGIQIARLPQKTKSEFLKLANEEFCGDYGMTLKWLIDDIVSADNRMIMETLKDHHQRLAELENSASMKEEKTEEPKVKKMLDGTERRT